MAVDTEPYVRTGRNPLLLTKEERGGHSQGHTAIITDARHSIGSYVVAIGSHFHHSYESGKASQALEGPISVLRVNGSETKAAGPLFGIYSVRLSDRSENSYTFNGLVAVRRLETRELYMASYIETDRTDFIIPTFRSAPFPHLPLTQDDLESLERLYKENNQDALRELTIRLYEQTRASSHEYRGLETKSERIF